MNGVNQHVGASAYVEYTGKLVEYFADVGDVEIISITPVNERNSSRLLSTSPSSMRC
ncbi:MAG: hypothetical protein FD139_2376 [Methylocystaceae bacterium]|nr:MAG: hypothetical protein FD148_935 [Methylocystaceae bacterium]KAF0213669.1 MAG: hypothetical protein FD172_359 [Methylocystaceae bacterium]TXT44198.1 MAG: hypothetical protein FD139_2376 [Methylocystaceae bacterium]